jgi:hypothetical protein
LVQIVEHSIASVLREWKPSFPPALAANAKVGLLPIDVSETH